MSDKNWIELNDFSMLTQFIGKIVEWELIDEDGYGHHYTGRIDSGPHDNYAFLKCESRHSWFYRTTLAVSERGMHGHCPIEESRWRESVIRRIRVLTDDEAKEVQLSYDFDDPIFKARKKRGDGYATS